MLKRSLASLTAALLAAVLNPVLADNRCTGTGTTQNTDLGTLLAGKLVCAYKEGQKTNPNARWSEMHTGTGVGASTLGEHGRGTTDTAGSYDANIGTWQISGNTVVYNYTDDGSYTYEIWEAPGTGPWYFCDASDNVAAISDTIIAIPPTTATNPCGY